MTMHSIRFKITAITIAAILTSVLCIFFVSFVTIQSENDHRSVEMMALIRQDTADSLEKYTEDIEQSMSLIANLAIDSLDSVMLVEGGVVGPDAEKVGQTEDEKNLLDAYLEEYIGRIQEVSATVAGHTHGVVSYYYCINPEIGSPDHGYLFSRAGKMGFVEEEAIDIRELDPNDLEHNTWYYTALEHGHPTWVGPYTAPSPSEMLICSYLVPIYKSRTFVGMLGMDIPLDTLISQVSSIRVYETGFACLLDGNGRIIYHPELEYGSDLDLPIGQDIALRNDSGNELIRYLHNGQERQLSFTTLPNDMKLAIVAPTAEVNASSLQLIRIIVPTTVAIIVIFTLLSLFLMSYITRPLLSLTAASRRLAAADYDVELNYKSKDEVGMLTDSFQVMRDQLKADIEDLEHKAHWDDLTGLPNQRYFLELAEEQKNRMLENDKHAVMLYFNLVGMKHFNRQHGFDEGDRLLRAVASVLANTFGELCTSRLGQDHFAATTDEETLEARLREFLDECRDINDGKTLPISVGIYQNSLETVDVSAACDRAKFACDQRKGTYESGWRYFDIAMVKQVETMRYLINNLDRALNENWIQVYYQPIVRATNGRVCDEEALSRWIDPEMGFLSPGDFIPALEDSGLIYKLDLYVLEQMLEKMRRQAEYNLTVTPHSLNLSRSDFDACDIVEEVRKRVDAAGIGRNMITIEITESIIGLNFDFMKEQITRFQELGFPVWMDDFGSGYSSLDVLKSISFDLVKFDMSFMQNLDEGENGKIILTQMMKMATAMGVDTICEGVETKDQMRFLQEIGCSKLQGYYFSRPLPFAEIINRYEKGTQIGFENPEESEYYETLGRLNLYDPAIITSEDESSPQNLFDTLPMGVVEIQGERADFVRTNQAYRDFMKRYFGFDIAARTTDYEAIPQGTGSSFMKTVRECCANQTRAFVDEQLPDGTTLHSFARYIGTNPVTGATAAAIAVISITEPGEGATYANIVRALTIDYYYFYYVNLDTERYIEYSSPAGEEGLAVERRGEHFFAESHRDALTRVHEEDLDEFLAEFTKENILRSLNERGVFTITYRLIETGEPMRMSMRVTRMDPEGHHIIIGVSFVGN